MPGKGKLVRDKIPEIIAKDGKTPIFRTASRVERVMRLAEKLVEETGGFAASGKIEKLADAREVVLALCNALGLSSEKLSEIATEVIVCGTALERTLVEQAKGFAASGKPEKLADIQGLIFAICEELGVRFERLEEIRKRKLEEHGGFKKGIILEGISGSA